jgi:selenocysteine lyase/cysteine desulfurase
MPDDLPERLEAGTCGIHDFAGLTESVKKCSFDINATSQKYFYLIEEFNKIHTIKIYGFSKNSSDKYVPIVLLNIDGFVPQELSKLLYNKNICVRSGFHCAPMAHKKLNTGQYGAVRLSIGKKNSFKDCEMLIQAIKAIAEK